MYQVRSTKYQVWGCASRVVLLIHFETNPSLEGTLYLVLGTLYLLILSVLYQVRSTKYQVWGCASRLILLLQFETNHTLEGTLYLVLGTLYKSVFPTLYLVLCTWYLVQISAISSAPTSAFLSPHPESLPYSSTGAGTCLPRTIPSGQNSAC